MFSMRAPATNYFNSASPPFSSKQSKSKSKSNSNSNSNPNPNQLKSIIIIPSHLVLISVFCNPSQSTLRYMMSVQKLLLSWRLQSKKSIEGVSVFKKKSVSQNVNKSFLFRFSNDKDEISLNTFGSILQKGEMFNSFFLIFTILNISFLKVLPWARSYAASMVQGSPVLLCEDGIS